ncbi:hypothetical protein NKW43_03910 [Gluconobacter albidus]|uniref:Uncharacterized protein n=1 Tax=Gluconobacter albidus TaxID=318683 RepID=A0AAW3QX71_9PROT|nr:hypothetical protein [Gluconobacter albidus]KXV37816.1 hypothetical protein AD941_08895 [Gluconobacter albidus]MCP1272828.1 hypothetical protein [Gluconobacter albidus]GBQ92522.1 hypothetical protein AA3250_2591 [Gluconobacter albidus NBRC 3250]GLQ68116.1 hypothetical protein GCM10007866_05640 [Gluconobacter albidus]
MKTLLASFLVLGFLGGTALAQVPKVENAAITVPSDGKAPVTQIADTRNSETCTQVWVNTVTHVYHVQGSFWYGATAHGTYMCEDDAKRAGNTRGQF